jgi:hypothetical protein
VLARFIFHTDFKLNLAVFIILWFSTEVQRNSLVQAGAYIAIQMKNFLLFPWIDYCFVHGKYSVAKECWFKTIFPLVLDFVYVSSKGCSIRTQSAYWSSIFGAKYFIEPFKQKRFQWINEKDGFYMWMVRIWCVRNEW